MVPMKSLGLGIGEILIYPCVYVNFESLSHLDGKDHYRLIVRAGTKLDLVYAQGGMF